MPTWTPTVTDTFVRANSASVGNGWTPYSGTNWSIASNQALFTFSSGTTYANQQLLRAGSETPTPQARVVFRTPALLAGQQNASTNWGVALRTQANGDSYFFQFSGAGSINVFKVIAGVATQIAGAGGSFATVAGHVYECDFYVDGNGTSTTTVSSTINDITGATTPFPQVTATDATASLIAGGQSGLSVNLSSGTIPYAQAIVYTGGALASTLTVVDNPNTVVLSQAAASGTPPYTFSWYRSSTSQAAVGTLLGSTGATASYTDTPPDGAIYYYRGKVVDNAAATITTTQIPGQKQPNFIIGCIGDSITNGTGASVIANCAANVLPAILARILGNTKVTTSKNGVDGTKASDWLTGSANLNAALAAINTAASGQPAGSKTYVSIMLGTNESRISDQITPATYKTNMANVVAGIKAAALPNFAGIILQKPPYINPYINPGSICNENSDALVQQYHAQIDALADGSTVFAGNTYAFQYFADNFATVLFDGLHPNDAGHQGLATGWAMGINGIVNPGTGGGGGFPAGQAIGNAGTTALRGNG